MKSSRTSFRILANQFFVRYPALGFQGYRFLRKTSLSRASAAAKKMFRHLDQIGFNPRVVLDIGANNGEWSWVGADYFPGTIFRLIEPQVEMAPFLDRFCRSQADARWLLAGAGGAVGEQTLTIWDDFQGSSFLPAREAELASAGKQRVIPLVTIDSLIEEGWTPMPDMVKLDIQGLELEVLRGAGRCFGQTELFVVEVSFFETEGYPPFVDIVSFMAENGYVVFDIVDLKRLPNSALLQADFCFVRRDGVIRTGLGWAER